MAGWDEMTGQVFRRLWLQGKESAMRQRIVGGRGPGSLKEKGLCEMLKGEEKGKYPLMECL